MKKYWVSCYIWQQEFHQKSAGLIPTVEIKFYQALFSVTYATDKDIAFFALMELHELSALLGSWKLTSGKPAGLLCLGKSPLIQ